MQQVLNWRKDAPDKTEITHNIKIIVFLEEKELLVCKFDDYEKIFKIIYPVGDDWCFAIEDLNSGYNNMINCWSFFEYPDF